MLELVHVLSKDVGVVGIFSDWPATTSFYANCIQSKDVDDGTDEEDDGTDGEGDNEEEEGSGAEDDGDIGPVLAIVFIALVILVTPIWLYREGQAKKTEVALSPA
mmetsp:Transcript_2493/g.4825  ORF Transcript_2493/g.4825 Transcript_2493/m.4825 type:complete len:105 (-) Transcript_2493:8-322(-)